MVSFHQTTVFGPPTLFSTSAIHLPPALIQPTGQPASGRHRKAVFPRLSHNLPTAQPYSGSGNCPTEWSPAPGRTMSPFFVIDGFRPERGRREEENPSRKWAWDTLAISGAQVEQKQKTADNSTYFLEATPPTQGQKQERRSVTRKPRSGGPGGEGSV